MRDTDEVILLFFVVEVQRSDIGLSGSMNRVYMYITILYVLLH